LNFALNINAYISCVWIVQFRLYWTPPQIFDFAVSNVTDSYLKKKKKIKLDEVPMIVDLIHKNKINYILYLLSHPT